MTDWDYDEAARMKRSMPMSARTAGAVLLASSNVAAYALVLLALLPAIAGPALLPYARAYTDETVAVHVSTACAADGQCRPELYVVRDDPGQPASVAVDYEPAWDPMRWNVTLRNVRNLTVSARSNYETRGCATFFADCPETEYLRWVLNQRVFTVVLDVDATLRFRLLHVARPSSATLDGYPYGHWSWDGDGITAHSIAPGVRVLRIEMRGGGGVPYDVEPVPAVLLASVASLIALFAIAWRRRG